MARAACCHTRSTRDAQQRLLVCRAKVATRRLGFDCHEAWAPDGLHGSSSSSQPCDAVKTGALWHSDHESLVGAGTAHVVSPGLPRPVLSQAFHLMRKPALAKVSFGPQVDTAAAPIIRLPIGPHHTSDIAFGTGDGQQLGGRFGPSFDQCMSTHDTVVDLSKKLTVSPHLGQIGKDFGVLCISQLITNRRTCMIEPMHLARHRPSPSCGLSTDVCQLSEGMNTMPKGGCILPSPKASLRIEASPLSTSDARSASFKLARGRSRP